MQVLFYLLVSNNQFILCICYGMSYDLLHKACLCVSLFFSHPDQVHFLSILFHIAEDNLVDPWSIVDSSSCQVAGKTLYWNQTGLLTPNRILRSVTKSSTFTKLPLSVNKTTVAAFRHFSLLRLELSPSSILSLHRCFIHL